MSEGLSQLVCISSSSPFVHFGYLHRFCIVGSYLLNSNVLPLLSLHVVYLSLVEVKSHFRHRQMIVTMDSCSVS